MKFKALIVSVALATTVLVGCGTDKVEDTKADPQTETQTDVVTTASLVNEESAFENAISENGTWIVAMLNDMTFDKELVVAGEFRNKGDATKDIYRKLAIYAQDEDHNVTERYTLTAPKLVVKSENFKIQGGTFVGDVYVEANGFTLTDAKVEGNVYFASEDMKSTFKLEKEATVSGATEVQGADAVTTASIVNEESAFLNAISENGTWIVATLNDMSFDKELVVAGEFRNKGDATKDIYRKLALYAQDADHKVTERYTLTAPKLVVKSENFKIQGGVFVGDIYVEANGFTLTDATVEGNVYFASEDMKSTFKLEKEATVSGATEVK